jgi:deoxyribodipyrimidine photo-lyase
MKTSLIIYWARRDLRLTDNPALYHSINAAKASNIPFAPIFILENYMLEAKPQAQFGYAQRHILSQALPKFIQQFPQFHLIKGKGAQSIIDLGKSYQIELYVNHDIYPDFTKQLQKIKEAGINIHLYADRLSINSDTRSQNGNLYSVFTPFKKSIWQEFLNTETYPKLDLNSISYQDIIPDWNYIQANTDDIQQEFSPNRDILIGDTIYDLTQYIPLPDLSLWYYSEAEALALFQHFLDSSFLDNYHLNRDSLEFDTIDNGKTSKMSLALAWGFVSSRTLRQMIQKHSNNTLESALTDNQYPGATIYISELIWREFYAYLLYHQPELLNTEFQLQFRNTIDWTLGEKAHKRFLAWITGNTGYPIVDAAMRQLAQTGWMHNRSRMIVASILTKHLGIDWRWGQEYFRATLVDLDEPSNNGGWQWGASVGADPKPIRIFNPYLQAQNYDTQGIYQAKWLGESYTPPLTPIIEHSKARQQAILRYKQAKYMYTQKSK